MKKVIKAVAEHLGIDESKVVPEAKDLGFVGIPNEVNNTFLLDNELPAGLNQFPFFVFSITCSEYVVSPDITIQYLLLKILNPNAYVNGSCLTANVSIVNPFFLYVKSS